MAFALREQLSARACRHADQEPMPATDAAQMGSPWLVVLTSRRARPVQRMPTSGRCVTANVGSGFGVAPYTANQVCSVGAAVREEYTRWLRSLTSNCWSLTTTHSIS